MVEINAILPSEEKRTFYIDSNSFVNKCRDIITTAEEEDIYLKIYHIQSTGRKELVYDSLFTKMASEVLNDNLSIKNIVA